jgi:putative protease
MNHPLATPELLSPAGDAEALRAAVANGADAVYFGLTDFNARHRAANFTLAELPETMRSLHEQGVRGYVTFNTLIFSDELPQAAGTLAAIIRAGADAVIVQDLGIVDLLRRMAPGFPVHGSTQMTLSEPRGIEFVKNLGVERVILARELSLRGDRVGFARADGPSRSRCSSTARCASPTAGQCLTSEALGGRSAPTAAQCAQACRQPYELTVDGERRDLGDKAYLLSPQDLAAWDLVGDLATLGVASLKIEGRLKSAHYVAATTQTYRAALDAAREAVRFTLAPQRERDLAQSFSRGFSHGFLSGVDHQTLVQGRFPKNRGVRIGTVVEVTARGVVVALTDELIAQCEACGTLPIKPGDGVVFDEGHPEQDEQGGRVYSIADYGAVAEEGRNKDESASTHLSHNCSNARTSELIRPRANYELTFGRGAVNLSAVAVGATLWKTDDPALRKRLEQTWTTDDVPQRTPLEIAVRGLAGEPLEVRFRDDSGHEAIVRTDQPVQTAIKHPLTRELLTEQLGRLGGTPFRLDRIELADAGGPAGQLPVMVPKSVLNDLRRRGVAELIARRRAGKPRTAVNENALAELRAGLRELRARTDSSDQKDPSACGIDSPCHSRGATFSLLCRTLPQLDAALAWSPAEALPKLDLLYCDFEEVRLSKAAVTRCRSAGIPVALATPRVLKPGEEGLLLQIARCAPDGVLVRNLAAISYYRERFPELALYGDYSLNVTNELTAALFAREGLIRLTPGYDLNYSQMDALLERIDPSLFEIVLHQHIPMFHMEHCVFSHVLSNGRDFHDCGRPCDRHLVELRDHVGQSHPLLADVGCRNTVFAARAQSAAPYVPRLKERGVRHFRVELLREEGAETETLIGSYARVLAGLDQGPRVWRALQVLNQIGLTRGTLEFE